MNILHLIIALDHKLFLIFNAGLSNPLFDQFFIHITNGKFWIVPAIIAVIVFCSIKKKNAVPVLVLALITIIISDQLSNQFIKPLFHRLRPCNSHHFIEGGRFLLGFKNSFSFPSSHAMNIFSQAALFTVFYRRYWIWFFVFASTIAFSRVYVGVHYPIDVMAGALFGSIIGLSIAGAYWYVRQIQMRRKNVVGSLENGQI